MRCLFLFFFVTSSLLCAEGNSFDERYAVEITRCQGCVFPPSIYDYFHPDDWTANVFIYFENGLYGVKGWRAKHESHAKQYSEFTYKGSVNILMTEWGDFSFIEKGSVYKNFLKSLWVDEHQIANISLVIHSIQERIEVQTSWFFSDTQLYHYTIQLNDGAIYHTLPQKKALSVPWSFGDRVALIGSTDSPCLVNLDASLSKKFATAEYLQLFPK